MDNPSLQQRFEATAATAKQSNEYGDGERFTGPTFTILAGPSQKEFSVHASVLRTCPVFARMCQGDFKEAHERQISLPEDSSQDCDAIVEYLYTGNFLTIGNPHSPHGQPKSRETCALELASVYVTAEKYQMDALKALVVEKFKHCTEGCAPAEVLAIADTIYPLIPPTDQVFPSYIRAMIIECMELRSEQQPDSNSKKRKITADSSSQPDDETTTTSTFSSSPDEDTTAVLDAWIEKGGRLAVDINRAYMAHWKKQGTAAIKRLRQKVDREQDQHDERHPRCLKCTGHQFETRGALGEASRAFAYDDEVSGPRVRDE
ncbi:MAG: hypothetical protein Q9208_006732 [Pyrenodesmia sp. 3 TL-2023]